MNLGFAQPLALVLALPLGLLLWQWRSRVWPTDLLRLGAGLAAILALAGPYRSGQSPGRDLVVLVDRSLSMPAGSTEEALELLRLAEAERGPEDRLAVLAFGAEARLEQASSSEARFAGFGRELDREASNLAGAVESALALIPEGRPGALLILSDGEATGPSALDAVRRGAARGVRVDVRTVEREALADVSVRSMELPTSVRLGEPYQFTAWVQSDRRVEARYELLREGTLLQTGTRLLEPGANRFLFRDLAPRAGVVDYRLRLVGLDDRRPENDVGVGALRVQGPKSILVLNHDGAEDPLTRALRGAGLELVVSRPEDARLDAVGLSAHRVVVLENVAADRLGAGLAALEPFVLERGGGLLVTGGKASFGIGGYHLSAIDELLPVSMEMREEYRQQAIALALVLDRSGSMGAEVGGGLTKMDLANRGSIAALELLAPIDSATVIAVDSAPHLIQGLTPVEDFQALATKVSRIRASGGGIYVHAGLLAAGDQLAGAPQTNRHVILFADAADAEDQAGVPALLDRFGTMGITVSVIALGTAGDSDAGFLRNVAERGVGDIYFTTAASQLPRLFAQDTLKAARSTFVEERTAVRSLPDLFGLGELQAETLPDLGGYNLTWLRPQAVAGAVTRDDARAPVLAWWYRGLGRSAVWTGELGGRFGGELVASAAFAELFTTLARWLAGQEEPEGLFPRVRREGSSALVEVEVDPDAPLPPETALLRARWRDPDGRPLELALERVAPDRFEARLPLSVGGVSLGVLELGNERFLELPPVALPYSPEFEHATDPRRGERLLAELAAESGGRVDPRVDELFRGSRRGTGWRPFERELFLLALVLLVTEVAFRRLQLSEAVVARLRRASPAPTPAARRAEAEASGARPSGRAPSASKAARPASDDPDPGPASGAPELAQDPEREDAEAADALGGALEAARRAAGRRLGR